MYIMEILKTVKLKRVKTIERIITNPKIKGNINLSSIFLYPFFSLPVIINKNVP